MTSETIVTTRMHPEFAPVVARWLWNAFRHDSGKPFDQLLAAARDTAAANDAIPQTFVFLRDDIAVGTASLIQNDLLERPDLTPWLAGVFVDPCSRGQGIASRLVPAVEDAARHASVETLWLHTVTAEGLYKRLGWNAVEIVEYQGKRSIVMRKQLIC